MPDSVPSSRRLWIGIVPGMTVPFVASLFYFVFLSEGTTGQVIYTGAKVFTLAWPVVCVFWLWRQAMPNLRGIPFSQHLRAAPLGILTGALIIALMYGLMQTPLGDAVRESGPTIRKKAEALGFLQNYVLFAVFLSIAHSLIEEYYWRWFVYGRLRRVMPIPGAVVLGSVAFASHHFVVLSQFFPMGIAAVFSVCVGVGGAIWCWHYQTQKTLAGAWISHLMVDAGLMSIGYDLMRVGQIG
jgi:membrane protease YdiL (CAAX protease family)